MGLSNPNWRRWTAIALLVPALARADELPASAPEPVPAPASASDALQFAPRARLEVEPQFSMSRLSAVDPTTGGRAVLASTNMNPGAVFRFAGRWNAEWGSSLVAGLQSTSFETTAATAFPDRSRALWNVGLEVLRHFSDDFHLRGSFSLGNTLFIGRDSTAALALLPVTIPSLGLGGEYTFLRAPWGALGGGGTLSLLFPTQADTFAVRAGLRYEAEAFYASTLAGWPVRAGLFFRQTSQNTTLVQQATTETGLALRLGLELMP